MDKYDLMTEQFLRAVLDVTSGHPDRVKIKRFLKKIFQTNEGVR